jgi:hypothetical protein
MKRKMISEVVGNLMPYEFEGKLADVIEQLNHYVKEYGPDAVLDWDEYFQYPYDQGHSPRFLIRRERAETDEERILRLQDEKASQKKRDERERAEYERLAAKYGAKV